MDYEWTVMPIDFLIMCMMCLTINTTIHIYEHTRSVFLGFFREAAMASIYFDVRQ